MRKTLCAAAVAWTMGMGAGERAEAQSLSPFYAGGGIGGFFVSADAVSGGAAAGSGVVGASVRPWLDVEAEVAVPTSSFSRTYGGDALSLSLASASATIAERERLGVWLRFDTVRRISASVSGVAVLHWTVTPGLHLGLVAGLGTTRVHDERRYTPVRLGAGVDPDHPLAQARVERETRLLGGPTIGARAAWRIAPRVTVAPEVRLDYGSIGDEINNAVRMSVKVLWRF